METLASFVIVPALVIAFFGSIFGLAQVLSPDRLGRLGHGRWPVRLTLWQMMSVVAVAAFLLFAFRTGYVIAWVFFVASFLILAWFVRVWSHEFVFLMGLRESDLPGRHDKLIWALLLLAVPPISIWLFRAFRLAHWPEPVQETRSAVEPETQGAAATQPA